MDSLVYAEALLAHVLERAVQAFIILVTQCDKPKWISRAIQGRQKLHQSADRAGQCIHLGFRDSRTANAGGKFRQPARKRNLLQHGRNLPSAQVKTDGFTVGDAHSRGPRFTLQLREVWHRANRRTLRAIAEDY